jgi:excisionase family DNA binding protein
MAQKLISLDEAAVQLGISKERLLELRQAGKVPGYRDGASWKFRSEAIDKLAAEGIPEIDSGSSDLSLDIGDAEEASPPVEATGEPSGLDLESAADEPSLDTEGSELNLESAGGSELNLEDEEMAPGPASDISLDDVDEPTVEGLDDEQSDALALDDADSIDLNTDSILLSEAELGVTTSRPPSTIIGKSELDLDADLDLSPLDQGAGSRSDVRLAGDSGLTPAADDELALDMPSPSGDFEGLEELEVDLEAESSRILSPEDIAKAQSAAKAAQSSKTGGLSDLGLAPSDSTPSGVVSDVDIGGHSSGNIGLSGLSALELDDDEGVLGEGSGSDVTLSGESSGINIISPSDSGLALDEVPLDLSGSAPIGSSLDLGETVGSDVALETAGVSGIGSALGLGSKVGEDFQLTPIGEEDTDDEKDSSQVIALDDISEETAGAPLASGFGDAAMIGEDFGAVGLAPGAAPVGAATAAEMPFSIWNVLSLAGCIVLLGLCGMMTFDLLRSMWAWDGVSSINSSLLEVLNPFM